MKKVALVSCSKQKQDHSCSAGEMYKKSVLFKKTLSFCGREGYNEICVLSAKYGLTDLNTIIDSYDQTLNSFTKREKVDWADKVFLELTEKYNIDQTEFYFFCGKNYLENLWGKLPHKVNLLSGMGIGQRLKFLME